MAQRKFICLTIVLLFASCSFAEAAASPKILARVALLSDPHVNLATNGLNAEFKGRFESAIKQVNAAKVDFVLIAGDLTQSGKAEEFAAFKKLVKRLKPPVLFVPGNHDVGHKFHSGQTNGTVTAERVADYEKVFGTSFFAKKVSGVRVVGINSSLLGSGLQRETEQWKFLEKQFGKVSPTPVILFMHYPLFVKAPDEPGGAYYNTGPEPRAALFNLLRQGGVKTVLTGHLHRSLSHELDGMKLITTPPISFGSPRGKQPEGWTLVTIFESGEVEQGFQPLQ